MVSRTPASCLDKPFGWCVTLWLLSAGCGDGGAMVEPEPGDGHESGGRGSSDGTSFTPIETEIIDHRPTMDARQIAYFVPRDPLPEGTRHLRVNLGQHAPVLSELLLRR